MTEFPETKASLLGKLNGQENGEAWEEFVGIYRPIIFRIAKRRGLQNADAEDVTQTILCSVADSVDRWEPNDATTKFRHWLRRVARNAIFNQLSRMPRDKGSGSSTILRRLEGQEASNEGQGEVDLELRRELFVQAATIVRGQIDLKTWHAFQMTVMDGISIEDTASRLEISVGSVYAARSRVMKRLKNTVLRWEDRS